MRHFLTRAACLVLSLAASAVTVADDTQAAFGIRNSATTVSLDGHVSSAAHEEILRELLARYYPDRRHEVTLVQSAATPPGWSLLTAETLRALAVTRQAEANVTPREVQVRGTVADAVRWEVARTGIERVLLEQMRLADTVEELRSGRSFAELCVQQWGAAQRGRRVEFHLSSSDLTPASLPLLDALVEIAADCPDARIGITGHTDASGDEAVNLALSRARAQAVERYLVARGIDAARLDAGGAGSAEPLDTSSTPAARARNRRIEFTFEL